MNFIEQVLKEEYDLIISQLTKDVELNLQSVGESKGVENAKQIIKDQFKYLKSKVKKVGVLKRFEDVHHVVTEYDILLNNTFDLPLVVILVKQEDKFRAIRSYHSVYPITKGHVFRPSIFQNQIEPTEPLEVVNYFQAISKGSTEDVMNTLSFEDDVYFREPAGWRWNHKSKEGLRAHFDHFFAEGGVPLKFHNYVYDAEAGSFAGEYTCDVWGRAKFKPQAGVSIYDINKETGKITGIRVYDNVDTNYV